MERRGFYDGISRRWAAAFFVCALASGLLVPASGVTADTAGATTTSVANASYEKYGTTSTGVDLYWTAYAPADGLRHPAVLVLHPGGFKTGEAGPLNIAEQLGEAGFLGLAAEYRLAPSHDPMNSPAHPVPGQNDVSPVDDGHYPEQTDDVQLAIRTARADPRCDGRVYCIGGSAGASHSVYLAATGTPGDDRPDLVVALSGPYELDDIVHLQAACVPSETCFVEAVLNYLSQPSPTDILDHIYLPFLADLHAASPTTYITADMPPLFIMCSSNDTGGVDTYQLPDLTAKLGAVGLTETKASVPTTRQYKMNIIPVPAPPAIGTHAFAYWAFPIDGVAGHPTVAATVINWFQAGAPTSSPTLLNVSARLQVGVADHVGIGGFIVQGTGAKRVMLRAIGPSLAQQGITGPLADPVLELHDSTGAIIAQNDNWKATEIGGVITEDQVAALQASTIAPTNSAEAALIANLAPGAYTSVMQGVNSGIGVGLVEVYDLDAAAPAAVVNLSTRGFVQTGVNELIGGFIVGGSDSPSIVVRALGPSLRAPDLTDVLVDPTLELYDANGTLIAFNDNWADTQRAELEAIGLAPTNSLEAAIESRLPAGNYTATVAGKNGTVGVGLVEVYKLP